jgi:HEAT repeat protein
MAAKSAIPDLTQLLKDSDQTVRTIVRFALKKLGIQR